MSSPSPVALGLVQPSDFRRAMRYVPTTVTVVSALDGDRPIGLVVGTFTSISMDPPLVGFFGDHRSSTLTSILAVDRWSFNVLHQDDAVVTEAFRGPVDNRFDGLDWTASEFGTPVIIGAVITIEAEKHLVVPTGDHSLVTGAVTTLRMGGGSRQPLVYFQGRMTRLDPGQIVDPAHWQLGWGA